MKLDQIALQVVKSAEEAAAVLLHDNPDFFSRLARIDLLRIAAYVAKSVQHGKPIMRISLRERPPYVRPLWPTMPYSIPSDLISCVLVRPVGIAAKHISLKHPLLWYYDIRLDLDLLKNKTQPEVWQLVRQLTVGKPAVAVAGLD